jgi:ATP-binding cassette subfamily B protein
MSPALPKTVLAFIWHYLRVHPWALFGFIVVSVIWAIELSLSPYLMKVIVDRVIATGSDYNQLIHAVLWPALIYASMALILNLTFRVYDYINLRIYPTIKSSITKDMFDYLLLHSL